jgi:hypothetical protein
MLVLAIAFVVLLIVGILLAPLGAGIVVVASTIRTATRRLRPTPSESAWTSACAAE